MQPTEDNLKQKIEALKHGDWEVRRSAVKVLGKMGAAAGPALVETLKDRDYRVRERAVAALGKMGADAIPALIQALKDSDPSIRRFAAEALGKIGDAGAVPALIETLKDSDGGVRVRSADALGELGDARAVSALINALKDSGRWVRSGASEALVKFGDAQTLPLRVLSSATLSPTEKLDTLEALSRVQYRYRGYASKPFTLRYPFPTIPVYCQNILNRVDIEDGVREGAEAVLNEIEKRSDAKILLRASTRDVSTDGTELVHAVSNAPSSIPTDQLGRPSEAPTVQTEEGSRSKGWFGRK